MKQRRFLAQLGMVITTMIWGITFVMVKDALKDADPFMFAFLRFATCRANSIAAQCIPRQIPKKGTFFSREY